MHICMVQQGVSPSSFCSAFSIGVCNHSELSIARSNPIENELVYDLGRCIKKEKQQSTCTFPSFMLSLHRNHTHRLEERVAQLPDVRKERFSSRRLLRRKVKHNKYSHTKIQIPFYGACTFVPGDHPPPFEWPGPAHFLFGVSGTS